MIATEQEILKDVLDNPGDTFYENVLADFLDEQDVASTLNTCIMYE